MKTIARCSKSIFPFALGFSENSIFPDFEFFVSLITMAGFEKFHPKSVWPWILLKIGCDDSKMI